MKKRVVGKKFSRGSGARRSLFRSLIRALVLHGAIVTTKAKAKVIQKQIDRIVNIAKKGTVAKRRQVYAILGNDRKTTDGLFKKIAPNFSDRVGGYTRIVNLPRRRGDAAEMARLEWVKEIVVKDTVKKKSKKDKKPVEEKIQKRPRISLSRGRKITKKHKGDAKTQKK